MTMKHFIAILFAVGCFAQVRDNNPRLLSTSAYAALGTPGNGTILYCSDCTATNPCAGSGSGAMARRENGAWVCGVAASTTEKHNYVPFLMVNQSARAPFYEDGGLILEGDWYDGETYGRLIFSGRIPTGWSGSAPTITIWYRNASGSDGTKTWIWRHAFTCAMDGTYNTAQDWSTTDTTATTIRTSTANPTTTGCSAGSIYSWYITATIAGYAGHTSTVHHYIRNVEFSWPLN